MQIENPINVIIGVHNGVVGEVFACVTRRTLDERFAELVREYDSPDDDVLIFTVEVEK